MTDGGKPNGFELSKKELEAMEKKERVNQEKTDKLEKAKSSLKLEVEQLKQEVQLAEMKHRSETESMKNSEVRLKMKVEGLEQKNQSLVEMLDKSATAKELFAGKQKDFELFKEITSRDIKWHTDQHSFLSDYFASEVVASQKKQLAELRDKYSSLKKQCDILEKTEKDLLAKEEEDGRQFRPRRESQTSDTGAESEIAKLRQTLAELGDSIKAKNREKTELLSGKQKEAVMQAYLRAEADELAIRARQHEIELEEESRSVREELSKLKRESLNKEKRFKEIETSNAGLRAKALKLDDDYELIKKKLDNLNRFSGASSDSRKEKTGEDMKIVESLQIEKKELRGDLEKLLRTKHKLEGIMKTQNERVIINQENILTLANLIAARENIDCASVQNNLGPEELERVRNAVEQKSPFDQRLLIEKLSSENAELTKKMKMLEARTLMGKRR
jgi:hypothetical protein